MPFDDGSAYFTTALPTNLQNDILNNVTRTRYIPCTNRAHNAIQRLQQTSKTSLTISIGLW